MDMSVKIIKETVQGEMSSALHIECSEPINEVLGALWKYENSDTPPAPKPDTDPEAIKDLFIVGDYVTVISQEEFDLVWPDFSINNWRVDHHPLRTTGWESKMEFELGKEGRITRVEKDAITVIGAKSGLNHYWPRVMLKRK